MGGRTGLKAGGGELPRGQIQGPAHPQGNRTGDGRRDGDGGGRRAITGTRRRHDKRGNFSERIEDRRGRGPRTRRGGREGHRRRRGVGHPGAQVGIDADDLAGRGPGAHERRAGENRRGRFRGERGQRHRHRGSGGGIAQGEFEQERIAAEIEAPRISRGERDRSVEIRVVRRLHPIRDTARHGLRRQRNALGILRTVRGGSPPDIDDIRVGRRRTDQRPADIFQHGRIARERSAVGEKLPERGRGRQRLKADEVDPRRGPRVVRLHGPALQGEGHRRRAVLDLDQVGRVGGELKQGRLRGQTAFPHAPIGVALRRGIGVGQKLGARGRIPAPDFFNVGLARQRLVDRGVGQIQRHPDGIPTGLRRIGFRQPLRAGVRQDREAEQPKVKPARHAGTQAAKPTEEKREKR